MSIGSQCMTLTISIHALREEGDAPPLHPPQRGGISIHAHREEGDNITQNPKKCKSRFLSTPSARRATWALLPAGEQDAKFLSTPSARRATNGAHTRGHDAGISIHALREEGD